MKNIKTYNLFTESLRDKLKGKDDDEIGLTLSKMDIYNRIQKIKNNNFDDKFLPSDDEIKKYLSSLDIEDWLNKVYEFNLDESKFNPSDEQLLKHILPDNITYNSENKTLEYFEWEDFVDLFQENRDVIDDYIGTMLSGMGIEYYEHYDIITPDYFNFKSDKIFQDVKTQIKDKIDELGLSGEDDYDEIITKFDLSISFRDLYDNVLTEYDILEEIKNSIDIGYTRAQELADESEAYDSLINSIIKTFNGGEVTYDNDKKKYIIPITIPNLDADDILDNSKIIEWSIPYYGYHGDVDDDIFREELVNRLDEI